MSKPSASKEFQRMSLDEIRKLVKKEEKALKKEYSELAERKKLIKRFQKIQKARQKVRQGINIKKKPKKKKTFQEYFDECIKNRKIPEDTPPYLKKALQKALKQYKEKIVETKTAIDEFAKQYVIEGDPNLTPHQFFEKNKNLIELFFKKNKNIKANFVLVCDMQQPLFDKHGLTGYKEDEAYFRTEKKRVLKSTNVEKLVKDNFKKINLDIEKYQNNGSGWYFKNIKELQINVVEYSPQKGSSYIDLPVWIKNKKAIINPKNKDDKCFIWCVLRYLHPKPRDNEIISDLKKYENELVTKGLSFPMDIKNIRKFEKLNPNIPSITVFSVEGKTIYPLKLSDKNCQKSIDLFLFEEDGKSHYSLIKNLSRLIRTQMTKSKVIGGVYICKRCLCHFAVKNSFEKHEKYCSGNKMVTVKMPKKGESLYFKNFHKKYPVPFVIYADFECFTKPVLNCKPDPSKSYNIEYQKHEPSGFCFYLKGITDWFKTESFTKEKEDDNVAAIFVNKIVGYTQSIYDTYYRKPKPMLITHEDKIFFNQAEYCSLCEEELGEDRVRDHCHFTGKYRGAAHNECNLRCRKPRVLPVIFHNLQGYDAHLFIKELAKIPGKLECIPSTEEKYISFSKHVKVGEFKGVSGKKIEITFEIRFIDSFKFLQTSLANLVSNLQPTDFINTKREFKQHTELITRKGVYPYDYVSNLKKFSETQLPPREEFYSKLNDEHISEEDFYHAIRVWDTLNCKTIRDYHDLYLKSDVLLLADVFENFRKTCLKHYNLDPAYYYTSPGLAWDACLKTTGQQLQLLDDYDMLMMFERGIRGGITHISKRYAEANNKYMKTYDPKKPSTYIQYLDANNLYGWAMSQPLPTHGFEWVENITKTQVLNIVEGNSAKGYIFDVDLVYPKHLWEKHNDYPLAPELIKVNGVEKLICHFKPRTNYVLHYKNLKQYLNMGLKLKSINRAISFEQSPWMEPYIRKNTELRKTAANSFEKDFFKLMNNSVFGKTIENIRKRQNIKLVDNRKTALKLSKKPNFERVTIFDKNLIAAHMKKTEVYFNKPVYVGQAILDLSKTLMFDFHYNYIKDKYDTKAELLFTDTDSLMYQIQTKDFYKDIKKDVESKFDTSDYPASHPSGIPTGLNKKVIGMFKDEVAGKQITHFIGLRPKLYSFKIEEGKNVKKCKGIKKSVVSKGITFEHYFDCLFTGDKQMRSMKIIQSKNHDIYSKEVNKIALSCEDDKRIVLKDKVHTLALR